MHALLAPRQESEHRVLVIAPQRDELASANATAQALDDAARVRAAINEVAQEDDAMTLARFRRGAAFDPGKERLKESEVAVDVAYRRHHLPRGYTSRCGIRSHGDPARVGDSAVALL
jgi:hypothetical protein